MTPPRSPQAPPPRSAEPHGATRRRRKRRARARKHHSRRTVAARGARRSSRCSSSSPARSARLRCSARAAISTRCARSPSAQNSFVYAANGSELGVIPAERNRTPVTRGEISPWVPEATVAIEDRRFYQHGGVDPVGIARAVVADVQAGKVVQGGSTITQELVRNLYLSRERTFKRKLIEACLAIKLSRQWSKDRILDAYMNQVFYGNHAYGIEAAAETYFSTPREGADARAGGAARRPAAGAVELRPVPQPAAGDRRAATRCCSAMLVNGDITSSEFAAAKAQTRPRAEARQALHPHPRAVLLQLRRGAAAAGVRLEHRARGRPQGLHDDQSRAAEGRDGGDHARAHRADRPCVRDRLDRPADRRDQGDGGGDAGSQGQPVQLRDERAPPAGLDVQDDRAHDRRRARNGSVPHVVPVGAAPLPTRLDVQPERSELRVERRDVRPLVPRRRVGRERDRAVRQHACTRGSRSTSARRTSSRWRASSASAPSPLAPCRRSRSARSR